MEQLSEKNAFILKSEFLEKYFTPDIGNYKLRMSGLFLSMRRTSSCLFSLTMKQWSGC